MTFPYDQHEDRLRDAGWLDPMQAAKLRESVWYAQMEVQREILKTDAALALANEQNRRREAAECMIDELAKDATRYRACCAYGVWSSEVDAAFDCGSKSVIDAAVDKMIAEALNHK